MIDIKTGQILTERTSYYLKKGLIWYPKFIWNENFGVVGIQQFLFTFGVCAGVSEQGWSCRWCFDSLEEAHTCMFLTGMSLTDGLVVRGNWRKFKGEGYGDVSNIFHPDFISKSPVDILEDEKPKYAYLKTVKKLNLDSIYDNMLYDLKNEGKMYA
jgi:hypothetical protein